MKNNFVILKTKINFAQTLGCGQIFSYKPLANGFVVFSADKMAKITEREIDYLVETDDANYFKNFFDLKTDYDVIKNQLKNDKILINSINFGCGIRILKQNLFETIISFVVSANNNIKRISASLFYLREHFGTKIADFFAFPTLKQLKNVSEIDFRNAGLGYRASQITKLICQLQKLDFYSWRSLSTDEIKSKLIDLSGIGPKVADCILLFGYGRTDVFPVDTWIEKSFNEFFGMSKNRVEIRKILVEKYGNLAGYAQQYLFFYQREKNNFTIIGKK